MKKAFTLVEILIVVAILGILAAVTLPMVKDYVQQAKESAARDNLRILRNAIELYAAQHNGVPPGYPLNNPSATPIQATFKMQMVGGGYLSDLAKNPFNDNKNIRMIVNDVLFPAEPTGQDGWVYQPQTKTIKLDWPGTDSSGTTYFDY